MVQTVLYLLVLYSLTVDGGTIPEPDQAITIARCRSGCLEEYTSDVSCESEDCAMCWQLCELLVVDSFSWAPLCTPQQRRLCTPGCRTACDVMEAPVQSASRLTWSFAKAPEVEVTSEHVSNITWEAPMPRPGYEDVDGNVASLLYVLYTRTSSSDPWETYTTTRDYYATIDTAHMTQLRLVAVSASGIVAETFPGQRYGNVAWSTTTETNNAMRSGEILPEPTITLDTASDVLQAYVTWYLPGPSLPDYVIVQWSRVSCQSSAKECVLPGQELYVSVGPLSVGLLSVTLPGITYNSQYLLEVFAGASFNPVHTVFFHTTSCATPDLTMTLCPEEMTSSPLSSAAPVYMGLRDRLLLRSGHVLQPRSSKHPVSRHHHTSLPEHSPRHQRCHESLPTT